MLGIYFDEYYELSDAKRKKKSRYDPDNVFLKACKNNVWFENEQQEKNDIEESVHLSDMPPIESDEEVKKGKD